MAILKDLIVHGSSRFLNKIYASEIQTPLIEADAGIFKKLKADDATVVGLLDVKGQLHTNSWSNSNIATIDGSFYITPTIGSASGTVTVTASSLVFSGTNYAVSSLYLGDGSSITWPQYSKVLVTGQILSNGEWIPLGTLLGQLSNTATSASISINNIKDNKNQTSNVLATLVSNGTTSSSYRNLKVSLYQRASSSTAFYPLGIYMTATGTNGRTFLDIYGGVEALSNSNNYGGFAEPNVRIGNLQGLPNVGGQSPNGWGIYTDNGYFKGIIAADQGYIGSGSKYWVIANEEDLSNSENSRSYIYNGTNNIASTVEGVYLGTDGIRNYKDSTHNVTIKDGVITALGVNLSGKIIATSGTIGGASITNGTLIVGNANINDINASKINAGDIAAARIQTNLISAINAKVSDLSTLTATIGGFQIDSSSIHTKSVAITSNADNSIALSSADFTRTINSTSRAGLRFAIGDKFGVTGDGTVYASNVDLIGKITATSGTIGGINIVNGDLDVSSISIGSLKGAKDFSSDNLLKDTYASSLTKENAQWDRYFSDASNSTITGQFIAEDNLPDPNATHFVRLTDSSASTKGRGLCFYSSGTPPFINGHTYRIGCWVRKHAGSPKMNITLGSYGSWMPAQRIIDNTDWEWIEVVCTFGDTDPNVNTQSDTYKRLYFYFYNNNVAGSSLDMCGFKMEEIPVNSGTARNFLLGTEKLTNWGTNNGITISDGIATFPSVSSNTWREIYPAKNFKYDLIRNQYVIFSVKVKAEVGEKCLTNLCIGIDTTETAYIRKKWMNLYIYFTGTGEWQTVCSAIPIFDYMFNSGSGTVDFNDCWVTVRIGAANTYHNGFQAKEPQLCLGTNATSWSRAPEDFDETIDNAQNTANVALSQSVEYIIGTQTAVTGSWTGISNTISELKDGTQIRYWLPHAGSGNATLNLTLANGTTTSAIPIYRQGGSVSSGNVVANRVTTHFPTGSVVSMTYGVDRSISVVSSGTTYTGLFTGWFADGAYDSGNTINRVRLQNAITAETAITVGHILCGTANGYKNIGANISFDLSYPLLYAGSAITASKTGDNNYLSINGISAANNGTIQSGAAKKTLYLKGNVTGNTFKVSASPFMTTVQPTTNDGYYYIPLGIMYNTTAIYFQSSNRLYAYIDGAFQPVDTAAVLRAEDAKKVATNYITQIDNTGIKITPYDKSGNDYLQINSDAISMYRANEETLRIEDDSIRIGNVNYQNLLLESNQISIRKGNKESLKIKTDEFSYFFKSGVSPFHIKQLGHIETQTGDGTKKQFTSNSSYFVAQLLGVTINNTEQKENDDYTYSIQNGVCTVTFTSAPANNSTINFNYDIEYQIGQLSKVANDTDPYSRKHINLSQDCIDVLHVYINNVETTAWHFPSFPEESGETITLHDYITLNNDPGQGANIKVVYKIQPEGGFYMTLGTRATSQNDPGPYSIVIGEKNFATGQGAFAAGRNVNVSGEYSFAYGDGGFSDSDAIDVTSNYAGAIGKGLKISRTGGFACGTYNTWSPSYTWAFQIGNGTGPMDRSDAFGVAESGNVYITGKLLSGVVGKNPHYLFTTKYFELDNITVPATGGSTAATSGTKTIDVTVDGYSAIGLMSFLSQNASSDGLNESCVFPYAWWLNQNYFRFSLRNTVASPVKCKITFRILYIATNAINTSLFPSDANV